MAQEGPEGLIAKVVDAGITLLGRLLNGVIVLFNPIFPPLSPLETKLLADVRERVSSEYLTAYDEHIARINFVQRDGGDRLTRMYSYAFIARYDWKRNEYFEPVNGIRKLIQFQLDFGDERQVFGSIVSIDGVLCNITFGEDIRDLRKCRNFNTIVRGGSIAAKQGGSHRG